MDEAARARQLSGLIPYPKGVSGNPGGKPVAIRNKLQTRFLHELAEDFDKNGVAAIVECRTRDPAKYIGIIAALMPKQVEQTKPLDDIDDAELAAGIAILRAQLAGRAGEGTGPPPVPSQVN